MSKVKKNLYYSTHFRPYKPIKYVCKVIIGKYTNGVESSHFCNVEFISKDEMIKHEKYHELEY